MGEIPDQHYFDQTAINFIQPQFWNLSEGFVCVCIHNYFCTTL